MNRLITALLAVAAIATGAAADTLPEASAYAVNFDRTAVRTRTDRKLTAIILDGNAVELTRPDLMYNDLTASRFTVSAGQTVTPRFSYQGQWMQGYIYVDTNRNGRFDVETPGAMGQLQDGNELLTFAGMNLEGGAYDSAGNKLANLAGVQPPAFTIPASLEPGIYMMRWKIDWNNCDPGGCMAASNDIISNGGAIVDILLEVTAADDGTGDYEQVFADEFDQEDGSRPDAARWTSSARGGSTWNRWISDAADVAFVRNGCLVCRAVPDADGDVPMRTGAVETRGKFSFTYGRVEVRLRTNLHTGNFPAAWMMPQPPCASWPNAGEIDIFESIDAQQTAYHTVHSHWTYDLGHKSDPASSFTTAVDVSQWHVYGLEWTPTALTWTVDGNVAGTYVRSADSARRDQGQWPFDHDFYVILNQSVGNGSWARPADTSYTYETLFDYVRVYQRQQRDGISDIILRSSQGDDARLYDLSGRRVTTSAPRPGIYIRGGRKVAVR